MRDKKAHYCFRQEAGTNVYKLYIYDDVTNHNALNWSTWEYEESETSGKFFKEALAEIPENATIELHINSCGGSVKEGIAIYNQLKQKKCKEIVAYVDGVAYSVASIILQAADRRIMGVGTSLLIHNMWMSVVGNASELRKAADDLDVLMEGNRKVYMERINITEEELIEMLENETYLTPEQAVEKGFADEVAKAQTMVPDVVKQLQEQLAQMHHEMMAQKALHEEMKEFCRVQQKKDTDDRSDDKGSDGADGDNDEDETEDKDDKKDKKGTKQYKLAELLGHAAVQYLKGR